MTIRDEKISDAKSGNSSGQAKVASASKAPGAFRTISEVADDLGVQQHVLRFWESKFPQVKPIKRGGGRRYYRPEDVDLLRAIQALLYDDKYTIKGVQKLIREQGVKTVVSGADSKAPGVTVSGPVQQAMAPKARSAAPLAMADFIDELTDIRDRLLSA